MDLTQLEFQELYLNSFSMINNQPILSKQQDQQNELLTARLNQIPSSINWVQQGDVTPVKDQGQCDASYCFAATGSMESLDAIFGPGLSSFSEQQLLDCSGNVGNYGCTGGHVEASYKYVIAYGITTEQNYPYKGIQSRCKEQGGQFKISSYVVVQNGNCTALQYALATQPIAVTVDASNWQFYSNGIFSNCKNVINFYALAVGYTPQYWLVKNSWGISWGEQGYIQLKIGNTCGICDYAMYPTLI